MQRLTSDEGPLLERLARARALLERERAVAPALCQELLALPRSEQEDAAESDPRFQTWGICEQLLARSGKLAENDPAESGHLAGLGLAVAEHLDSDLHAAPVVSDLEARLWAAAGEAWRRLGNLRQAEEALAEAAGCLAHGTGDLLLDAQLLEFEAAVRADQGRIGEADALLKQAAARFATLHENTLHARVLARRAQLRRLLDASREVVPLGYGTGR
jgi:tetratricopeptide (TPR) repeat protein